MDYMDAADLNNLSMAGLLNPTLSVPAKTGPLDEFQEIWMGARVTVLYVVKVNGKNVGVHDVGQIMQWARDCISDGANIDIQPLMAFDIMDGENLNLFFETK